MSHALWETDGEGGTHILLNRTAVALWGIHSCNASVTAVFRPCAFVNEIHPHKFTIHFSVSASNSVVYKAKTERKYLPVHIKETLKERILSFKERTCSFKKMTFFFTFNDSFF